MSENCPKCGSPRTKFEGQTSWECGSYQSLIGGSHIKTPAFKLIESEHCLCRTALAAATKRAESAEQENATRVKEYREKVEQLETDKAFYHDKWLNALERLKAAEQEDARMSKRLSMDALESDVAALLAQPKGGPDA